MEINIESLNNRITFLETSLALIAKGLGVAPALVENLELMQTRFGKPLAAGSMSFLEEPKEVITEADDQRLPGDAP